MWYNNIDTGSGVEAVLYHAKLIDLFKEAFSAPDVTRKQFFKHLI